MKKEKCVCVICGADITRSIKFYPKGLDGGPYCYECNEARKVRRADRLEDEIITMYKRKKKISEIALALKLSPREVFEVISAYFPE